MFKDHTWFIQAVHREGLDHVVHGGGDDGTPPFVAYVSLRSPCMYLVHELYLPPSSKHLMEAYHWVLRHRASRAYPFLSMKDLCPVPNESRTDAAIIGAWCDSLLDAFTLFRYKQVLQRGLKRKKGRAPP